MTPESDASDVGQHSSGAGSPTATYWRASAFAGLVLLLIQQFGGRSTTIAQPALTIDTSLLSVPAGEWAKRAAANEIKIIRLNSPHLRYQVHQVDSKGDKTRDVIESKEGTVARLIARSGKPLTKAQDDAERGRLQVMLNSPQEFARHTKSDLSWKKTAAEVLGAMPEAMTYSYAPGQPQRTAGAHEVVLDFVPNADWKPPTLVADTLTGLEGRIWIDPKSGVVSHMDARVVRSVNFGWGMLAHVYPGGAISLEQKALPVNRFIVSHLVENLTLRAMLVKTIKVHGDTTISDFTLVGEMTYQQAIETLLATPLATTD